MKLPLVCTGGTWQAETAPQAPSDRWLSVGPPILLHGEGCGSHRDGAVHGYFTLLRSVFINITLYSDHSDRFQYSSE
ncbi:hypothetical protein BST36_30885, partial [Mycolicibacterium moriokaense]